MEMGILSVCLRVEPECPRDFRIAGQATAVEATIRQFPNLYIAH
jgi:hypothetical protein